MARNSTYSDVCVELSGGGASQPLVIEITGRTKAIFMRLLLAAVVGAAALFINDMLPGYLFGEYEALARQVLPIAMGAFAILYALRGVFARTARTWVQIANGTVEAKRQTLLGSSNWTEPLGAYQGVRWTRFIIRDNRQNHGRHRGTQARYRHVLELAHTDPAKSLPLVVHQTGRADLARTLALVQKSFATKNKNDPELRAEAEQLDRQAGADHLREQWEMLAAMLELPAIDARDGVEAVRNVEDLDKSLRQLAEQGKVVNEWKSTPPPEPLEVEQIHAADEAVPGPGPNGSDTRIAIRTTSNPILFYFLGGGGALMAVIGLVTFQFGLIFAGLVFGGVVAFLVWQARTNPRTLTVADGEIRYEDPSVQRKSFTLPLAGIEGIELRNMDADAAHGRTMKLQGRELLISSDQGEYPAGSGLPEPALEWLKGHILDAATKSQERRDQT